MQVTWAQHRAIREQAIQDQGYYLGLFDENAEPFDFDMPPVTELSMPETRHEPSSMNMTLRLKSPSGVIHPAASALIASDLHTELGVDEEGALNPIVDHTRMVVMETPGNTRDTRRAYLCSTTVPLGVALPSTTSVDGVEVLGMLERLVAPSIPASWTNMSGDRGWVRTDRDWAGPWSRARDIKDTRIAAVAMGYTESGPAEATIRRVIQKGLTACFTVSGQLSNPPVVVDQRATGRTSPQVVMRPTDGNIWETVSPYAVANGVRVSARLWLPGDDWSPVGHTLSLPTIVVFVEQT